MNTALHLFIDSNIFLNFFSLTSDDLEELKKLIVLIDTGDVTLYLPTQVALEVTKNRERVILESLDQFKQNNLNNAFPNITKEYPEYDEMRKSINSYKTQKKELQKKLYADIENKTTKADKVISDLFEKANYIKITDDLYKKASMRFHKGFPPRKEDKVHVYGDAISWETLLSLVPAETDLYLISQDSDFQSKFNREAFSPFLMEEWKMTKESSVFYYRNLTDFFQDKFPHIKLASEHYKDVLIGKLQSSGTFATSRAIMSKLSTQTDFSPVQINNFVEACIENSQVYQIISDKDIHSYVSQIIKGRTDIEPNNLVMLTGYLDGKSHAQVMSAQYEVSEILGGQDE